MNAAVWWVVSTSLDDQGEADGLSWQLVSVEFRQDWRDAKNRFRELSKPGAIVEVFDFEGEAVLGDGVGNYICDLPHMGPPMEAGLYRFQCSAKDSSDPQWAKVAPPPLASWRRTPGAINAQRTGRPL